MHSQLINSALKDAKLLGINGSSIKFYGHGYFSAELLQIWCNLYAWLGSKSYSSYILSIIKIKLHVMNTKVNIDEFQVG